MSMRKLMAVAVVAASATVSSSSWADVVYSIDGNTMTVTAPATYGGKGLWLLWDSTDKGDVVADWSNSLTLTNSVPAVGGTWTVDLAALGITNGTPCRIASFRRFMRLDMLKQSGFKSYINSGILRL
ncbi:MAG: hypothetical protein J5985_00290 [Kiritimatiellae bacterium]|nr:hypothetical protein [Kiritimatiellia bacterium]